MITQLAKKDAAKPTTTATTACTPVVSVFEQLTGKLVQGNFLVGGQVGKGSFGMVFKSVDVRDMSRTPLAMKASTEVSQLVKEIDVLLAIH